jgi:hypothetical protein
VQTATFGQLISITAKTKSIVLCSLIFAMAQGSGNSYKKEAAQ